MSKLLLLKSTSDLHSVANLLGLKPAHLAYNLYKKSDAEKYTKFEIPKRCGGKRTICAPIADLKHIQRLLAVVLMECLNELNAKYNRQAAHGFITKRSILTNAQQHRGRGHVLNLDLQDFFGSINFGRVRGFFIADKDFALQPAVATVLAQIACFENALPQGSPASPVISNLIGNVLDTHLIKLARKNSCVYTRYADDLTFSTNLPSFPEELAILKEGVWTTGTALLKIIKQSGFEVNASKVRMQFEESQQNVTGLVVNQKVNTAASYRSSIRAMAKNLFKTGSFTHDSFVKDLAGTVSKQTEPGTMAQLQGMFGHVKHVDEFNLQVRNQEMPLGRAKLYKRFFLFSQFFCSPRPVILCEGKTDNIYLLHAIRSRSTHFPQLAQTSVTGKITLLIRIFEYVERKAGGTLGMSSGGSEVNKFIGPYLTEVSRHFKAPGVSQHPVILIVDHDNGGKNTYATATKKVGKTLDMLKPFEHVAANLYLVPTPLPPGSASSCIENCFQPSTLAKTLGGKTFHYKTNDLKLTEYGKSYFAEHVVKAEADKIDFSGFDPLLDRINSAIAHYVTLPK